jgi:ribosome-binding protein aMBF1 (putative translation factor)
MERSIQTIRLGGTEYVIIPRAEYGELAGRKAAGNEVLAVDFAQHALSESLRTARESPGLTQAELAARLKKSQPMVSGAESGRVRVGAAYVKAVLKACKLPEDWTARKTGPKRRTRKTG